ncbi:hypothetical protein OUZ56_014209 [Daphnia magna]|uniref:Uncharacterized protein n=1 Tax=Daphnia magna TaxID=35525 RepID=A0ABQ9Z8S2_9CRUS|nr:hypothetical protein OUZ56_014209 [Daphnia magna]
MEQLAQGFHLIGLNYSAKDNPSTADRPRFALKQCRAKENGVYQFSNQSIATINQLNGTLTGQERMAFNNNEISVHPAFPSCTMLQHRYDAIG